MSDAGSGWDDVAAEWDQSPGPRAYALAAFESLIDVLAARQCPLDGARVLDFGCGTGLLIDRLAGRAAAIDAVDVSPAMLDVVREKIRQHRWSHVRASSELPSRSAVYDLVVASSVCSFLDDYPATVRDLAALLRPGGVFVQWDWERDESATDPDTGPHGLARLEVQQALVAAGLVDVVVESAFRVTVDDVTMEPLIGAGTSGRIGDA